MDIVLPPGEFVRHDRSVHVWPVRLASGHAVAAQLRTLLSPLEASRLDRMRFGRVQRASLISRAALRLLLGGYLRVRPEAVEFNYGAMGKPSVANVGGGPEFSVSHSGEVAVFAFSWGCDIGVDVEEIRPLPDLCHIAARFFCAEETAELMSLRASDREDAFFRCWTRKEAYLKATGEGLSASLSSVRVTLRPSDPARLVPTGAAAPGGHCWTMQNLKLGARHAAALVYRGGARPVRVYPRIDPTHLLDVA